MRYDEPPELHELATAEVPPPDPAFVEMLDARLRVAHADARPAGGAALGLGVRWLPALAVSTLLAVGLVGALALARGGDSAAVVMTVASDTSVYLDGTPMPGRAGLELPDGARIVVGPTGEAVVDGVVLSAGSEAVVVDDRVTLVAADDELADRPPPVSVAPPITGSTTTITRPEGDRRDDAPTSTALDADRTTTRPTTGDGGPATSATVAPEPTRPTSTRPATTRPSTTPSSVATASSGATTATTAPAAGQISLTVTPVGDDRLRLEWAIGPDLAPMGWRVMAGAGDRQAILLVIRSGDARTATLIRAETVGRDLWVEAVDGAGHTLAASEPVAIR